MRDHTVDYRKAVEAAIQENHALGLPVYQCKDKHIVAIYPGGREVILQKVSESHVFAR